MEQIRNFFAPSIQKIRVYLGLDHSIITVAPKDYVRALLPENITLSVPIEGGNSLLKQKNLRLNSINISQHGDWQHQHLGAWQAIYGKSPYFPHIYPLLEDVYTHLSYGSLVEFNSAIFKIVIDFLELDAIQDSVERLYTKNSNLLKELHTETLVKCDEQLTVLDPLFKLGKDAVYLFI